MVVLTVINQHRWKTIAAEAGLADKDVNDSECEKIILEKLGGCLKEFPGYAQIYHSHCIQDPWTVENGLLTPTMKMKRKVIMERFESEIEQMYSGHT